MSDAPDNVVYLGGMTKLDIPVERVLKAALENDLDEAIVIGTDKDGDLYFASTTGKDERVSWLLERARALLMHMVMYEGGLPPART